MKINEKNLCGFAVSDSPIDKDGWLLKRGEVNKSFQRRWFALKGNLLFYFEKKTDKEPSGVIVLEGCTIELAEYEEQYAFKIVFHGAGDRTYILGADTQETMEAWMKALACASYDYMKLMVLELQRKLDEIVELEKAHTSIFEDVKVVRNNVSSEVIDKATGGGKTPQVPARLHRGNSQPKSNDRINPFDRDSCPSNSKQQQLSSSAPGTPSNLRHAYGSSTRDGHLTVSKRVEHLALVKNETTAKTSPLCRPFFDLHEIYGRTIRRDVEAWNKTKAGVYLIDLKAV